MKYNSVPLLLAASAVAYLAGIVIAVVGASIEVASFCGATTMFICACIVAFSRDARQNTDLPKYAVGQLVGCKFVGLDRKPTIRLLHIHDVKRFDEGWRYAGYEYTADQPHSQMISLTFYTTVTGVPEDHIVPLDNAHEILGHVFKPWSHK